MGTPQYRDGLPLQLGLAGTSCFFAQASVHWVETTMVRQQLASHAAKQNMFATTMAIAKAEGIRGGLYRGFSAASLREFSYSSLRFGLYEPIKGALGTSDDGTVPFWKKILAGLSAGAFASAVASPTDLLKIRMQKSTGPPRSIFSHAAEIAGEAGATTLPASVKNFYRGVSATITRASLLGGTKMATYDQTKTTLRAALGWSDDVPSQRYGMMFVASVAAGLAISVVTSPATNVRTFLMASEPGTYRGMGHAFSEILRRRGPIGLYRGFGAQWARFGPYALVQYFAWEELRRLAGMRPL